jgi:Rrf2 family protein
MRITNLAEYGVICALHLARRTSEGAVSGREIAELERLPADYVEQILLRLRRAGVVRSTRGAHGGYQLARPAEEITIRHVIEASEETTFHLNCESHPVGEDRCSSSHTCSIRPVWMLLQRRIDEVLEGVRLSDLLDVESDVQARVGLSLDSARRDGAAVPPPNARSLPVLSA